jgi:hypothetical protein
VAHVNDDHDDQGHAYYNDDHEADNDIEETTIQIQPDVECNKTSGQSVNIDRENDGHDYYNQPDNDIEETTTDIQPIIPVVNNVEPNRTSRQLERAASRMITPSCYCENTLITAITVIIIFVCLLTFALVIFFL